MYIYRHCSWRSFLSSCCLCCHNPDPVSSLQKVSYKDGQKNLTHKSLSFTTVLSNVESNLNDSTSLITCETFLVNFMAFLRHIESIHLWCYRKKEQFHMVRKPKNTKLWLLETRNNTIILLCTKYSEYNKLFGTLKNVFTITSIHPKQFISVENDNFGHIFLFVITKKWELALTAFTISRVYCSS